MRYAVILVLALCGCQHAQPKMQQPSPEIIQLQHRVYELEKRVAALELAPVSQNCTTTGNNSSCVTGSGNSVVIDGVAQ